ncbi:hypothetical protein CLHOM_00400 [Clostridium homopropionicum DSM 5847]|uniref:Class I SAM-dependent methyltransferase n=1 Tax=Clostridium homopropionicum DSM 5847 TaxID=1121318 RepID=A0A0L6ZEF9_9CLOT|nr:hypothetical protein [Clostridium homopropionicum]KOA21369.1 hypothetical protein CLHOM_00400 [Clostridium homopropionicum DSM 5847]SFG12111.1 hypothetical protein SAMN04488501_105186 [Clostridium homopropionicum]
MQKEIILNLIEQKFNGNILDIGFFNYGIVYNIIKNTQDSYSLEYFHNESKNINIDENFYDSSVLFFSFSEILFKVNRRNLLLKIYDGLKEEGILHIWDKNKGFGKTYNNKLKILLPQGKIKEIIIKDYNIFKDVSNKSAKNLLCNKFDIIEEIDEGEIYYIKAQKRRRKNNEETKGSSSGD